MNKLSLYLSDTGQTLRDFAKKVGCSPSYLHEIANGVKQPSLDKAFKIESVSNGEVLARSLIKVDDVPTINQGQNAKQSVSTPTKGAA